MPTCDYSRALITAPAPPRDNAPLRFPSALKPALHPECHTQLAEVAFMGDAMMHRANVRAAEVAPGQHDLSGWFDPIAPILRQSDLAIVNLETNLAGLDLPGFEDHYTGFPRFNSPPALLDALREAGVDVVQTANNHTLDRGLEGHRRTLDAIDAHGLRHTGSWRSEREHAEHPFELIALPNGATLAFLAYTFCVEVPGIWPLDPWSVNLAHAVQMVRDVKAARTAGADIVAVGVHWGAEYREWPLPQDVAVAEALSEAGVDILFGTHPHVVAPIEVITSEGLTGPRDTLVMYSLGNLLSAQRATPKDAGMAVRVTVATCPELGRSWVAGVRFTPSWVDTYRDRPMYRVLPNPPPGSFCFGPGLSDADCAKMARAAEHHARLAPVAQWDYGFTPLPITDAWTARMLPDPLSAAPDGSAFRYLPLDAPIGVWREAPPPPPVWPIPDDLP